MLIPTLRSGRVDSRGLEVPRINRRRAPVVVAAIRKSNGLSDELRGIDVVEGGQLDGDIITPNLFDVSTRERAHAAVLAEEMMSRFGIELVVTQIILTGQQSERARLDDRVP